MNLNKKELKIISYDFNCLGNRLLRVAYEEIQSVLKMFIKYIENTPIIYDYIIGCERENFNVVKEIEEVTESYGRCIFGLGDTIEEEVFTVYNILKYINEENVNIRMLTIGYSDSKKYQERVKDFNNRVTLVLIQHIASYLTKIGIEMGIDEEVKYMITVNGGQVNISKDSSTINATQNNGSSFDELGKMVKIINELLDSSIPKDDKEMIEENIETIQSELQNDNPKKGLIKTCIMGLKTAISNVPEAIVLCNNVEQFIEYISHKIS